MYEALSSKRTETDQKQTTTTQKSSRAEQPLQRSLASGRFPLYTQAWGNQIPPWLRLSPSPQIPQEERLPQGGIALGNSQENSTALPDSLKTGVETLSGYSLNDARVHYNSPKPAEVDALAHTQGTDIYLGPGQEKYLAHEAWHVIQQKQGRVEPTMQKKGVVINDDQELEQEADMMGAKALQMTQPQPRGTELEVHRPMRWQGNPTRFHTTLTHSLPKIVQRKITVDNKFYTAAELIEQTPEIWRAFKGAETILGKFDKENRQFATWTLFNKTFIQEWAAWRSQIVKKEQTAEGKIAVENQKDATSRIAEDLVVKSGLVKASSSAIKIKIVDVITFKKKFVENLIEEVDQSKMTDEQKLAAIRRWETLADGIAGFYSRRTQESYIRESIGSEILDTAIHETIHHHMRATILTELGFGINEGVTEFFTQKVYKDVGLTVGKRPYVANVWLIELLMTSKEIDLSGLSTARRKNDPSLGVAGQLARPAIRFK